MATGASSVFDTSRSRFAETDRQTLQRIVPHLVQLSRSASSPARMPVRASSSTTSRSRGSALARRRPSAWRRRGRRGTSAAARASSGCPRRYLEDGGERTLELSPTQRLSLAHLAKFPPKVLTSGKPTLTMMNAELVEWDPARRALTVRVAGGPNDED